jgi:hypothetical protein
MTTQVGRSTLTLSALLLVVLAGCRHLEKAVESTLAEDKGEKARARVEAVLGAMQKSKTSTDTEMQLAMCLWYADKMYIKDYDEANEASDGFDRWRNSIRLDRVTSFQVTDAVEVPEQPRPTYHVRVIINGRGRTIRVPESYPMSWAKKGR